MTAPTAGRIIKEIVKHRGGVKQADWVMELQSYWQWGEAGCRARGR